MKIKAGQVVSPAMFILCSKHSLSRLGPAGVFNHNIRPPQPPALFYFIIRWKAGFVRKFFGFFGVFVVFAPTENGFLWVRAGKSGIFARHSIRVRSSPIIFAPMPGADAVWGLGV